MTAPAPYLTDPPGMGIPDRTSPAPAPARPAPADDGPPRLLAGVRPRRDRGRAAVAVAGHAGLRVHRHPLPDRPRLRTAVPARPAAGPRPVGRVPGDRRRVLGVLRG